MKQTLPQRAQTNGRCWRLAAVLCLVCSLGGSGGCAAISNPVGQGIPVTRLPPQFLVQPKEELRSIPLSALRQPPPEHYRLAKGDILGVYIEGILGEKGQAPPVRYPETANLPPAIGYPVPVREDGTLSLPYVAPVPVTGKTVQEAEEAIRKAYLVNQEILKNPRILVSLMRPRHYRVQVVRGDSGGASYQVTLGVAVSQRRGTGAAIDLPAYENDVLNALDRTGGLPGVDAQNEVTIERQLKTGGTRITRLPLRLRPGEQVPFSPQEIILEDGDVVFVEPRDTEVFYTGGLLVPRQYVLPRDYDLRVTEVVALAGGPLINGPFTQSNLSGNILATGLGSPSPSRVTVLRRTKNEGRIPIIVSLNKALRDPKEDLIIQGGDMIIVQETVGEALTRYITNIYRISFTNIFLLNSRNTGVQSISGP